MLVEGISPYVLLVERPGGGVVLLDRFLGHDWDIAPGEAGAVRDLLAGTLPPPVFAARHPVLAQRLRDRGMLATPDVVRSAQVASFTTVDLELSAACNAVCSMCPRSPIVRKERVMSEATFAAFLRQSSAAPMRPRLVYFAGYGEPLLNKHAPDFARQLKSAIPEAEISLVTNGSLMNKPLTEAIVASGIGHVSVSFQGCTPEIYNRVMHKLDFHQTLAHVEGLIALARSTRLGVTATMVDTPEAHGDAAAYAGFWRARGIKGEVLPMHNRGGYLHLQGGRRDIDDYRREHHCLLFSTRVFIASDGEVLACPHDLEALSSMGNLVHEPLETILARKAQRICGRGLFPMCATCTEPGRLG
jgi:hypothetical protein